MSTATPTRPSAARERILDTAFALFYARGIRAVGVDLIIAESGVAKATFYKHFPAKDDLVVAYLDKVDGVWTGQLQGGRRRPPAPTPADAAGRPVRRPRHGVPPRGLPRLRLHQRRGRVAAGHRRSTTARSRTRPPCSTGCATSREQAGARGPRGPGPVADPAARRRARERFARRQPGGPEGGPGLRRRPGVGRHRRVRLRHGRPSARRRRGVSLHDGPGRRAGDHRGRGGR